jgi:thiamine biosynthesis lipoprotein
MYSLRIFSLVIISVVFLAACSQQSQEKEHYFSGRTMGTTYNVKFISDQSMDADALQQKIDQRLIDINQLMSTYIVDSELSLFNRAPSQQPYTLSPETAFVVAEAMRLGEISGQALDITVGPLVNLWGFGPTKRPETVPSALQIADAKALSGLDKLTLEGVVVTKSIDNLYVDLSTIAKGYGVDAIAELLIDYNLTNFLVEIGGEMRVAGNKLNGDAWRIAIEKPVSESRTVQKIISVGDNAIATSGDYRNYYEEEGIRYSHLIDPTTGYPIQHNTVSATVVHPSSMTADGLATAMMVLSAKDAQTLAEEQGIALLLILKEGEAFVEYQSPVFAQMVTIIN